MAESSLSMPRSELLQSLGFNRGYGRGADAGDTAWDSRKLSVLEQCVRAGVRQFYTTPPVPGLDEGGYDWTFLHPVGTATLLEGESTVALPDDFARMEEKQIVIADDLTARISVVGVGDVEDRAAQNTTSTGRPQLVAVAPKRGTTLTNGQRFELLVYPTADQDYTLRFPYVILPDALSDTHPWVYGGAQHAGTLEASCLAASERIIDGLPPGAMWAAFMSALAGSIVADRRMRPSIYGRSVDRSDDWIGGRPSMVDIPTITIAGVTPV